jgi:hypothetical protein
MAVSFRFAGPGGLKVFWKRVCSRKDILFKACERRLITVLFMQIEVRMRRITKFYIRKGIFD